MDEHDFLERDSGSFSFQPMEEAQKPPQIPKKRTHIRAVLALAAVLAFTGAGVACGLVLGMQLRFSRLENSFSLALPGSGQTEQSDEQDVYSGLLTVLQPDEDTEQDGTQEAPPEGQTNAAAVLEVHEAGSMLSLQEIYVQCQPSVVSIVAAGADGSSSGTGIVLTSDGYLVTNAHVIDGAGQIEVTLSDDTVCVAALVGADSVTDLAVLKIDAQGLVPAEFGDSDALVVGDGVVAIGDPLGSELRGTMTDGIICGINRDLEVDGRKMTLIQTNAALNEGNSGGPLINLQGQVIGINTMKMSSAYASIEGLGFAIPSATALPIINELLAQGYISGRPDFGFDGITVPTYAQFYYRLPSGVYIQQVDPDSDAAAKGLSAGDVITAVDETLVYDLEDLNECLSRYSAGDIVTLTVYHRGGFYSVEIVLDEAVA